MDRMSTPARGINILFCFYLPESSLLHLTASLTIKWQIFHNGWCPYIQLIKVSFREKGSHTESFCCRLYIFCNIRKHLAVWIFFVGLFDLLPCWCKYNGEEKDRNIYFLFPTWGNRWIHLNNHFHCNDSWKVNMNIEGWGWGLEIFR